MRLVLAAACALLAGCGSGEVTISTRHADDVLVVGPDEAGDQAGQEDGDGSGEESGGLLSIDEPSQSFQAQIGDALIDFNVCLANQGRQFIGIPGQSGDPGTLHPDYVKAVTSCNNESGVSELLDQQLERSINLTALERQRTNEERRVVYNCLIDLGWELAGLEPNTAGLLVVTGFPPDLTQRQEAFSRDLDLCGWNDLEFN